MSSIITFSHKGNYKKLDKYFGRVLDAVHLSSLDQYGQQGVEALAAATPIDSGKTAESWQYEIIRTDGDITISWTNTNVNKGINIAVILQRGHGTRNGGYVAGRDYINPAIQPIFDEIADSAWKEITK